MRFNAWGLVAALMLAAGSCARAQGGGGPVRATDEPTRIVLDNGLVSVEISKPKASIVSIKSHHNGVTTELSQTMYWSASAGPTDKNAAPIPKGSHTPSLQKSDLPPVRLVRSTPNVAEVVIEGKATPRFPYNVEIHYLMPRGVSGFYAYQIYAHPSDQPAATIGEARFVIKGPSDLFTNHVVDEKRMGPTNPSPVVRQVMDATTLRQDGSVYTKYDNSAFMENHYFHGMTGRGVGIWMINASNEYVNGGPVKQELTVHQGNTLLNMLQGAHFGSGVLNFAGGEDWQKFYGPFLVYVNHAPTTEALFADAGQQAGVERAQWPYAWVQNPLYPVGRGTVTGQLKLTNGQPAANAMVVLAAPGGDWPLQGKGYEFWARTDGQGRFQIGKARPGTYTLYACGANQFEQFSRDGVRVATGTNNLGELDWKPVTHGKTLWQIGVADRATGEFRGGGDNARHWANYLRYPQEFPDDVTYTVGKSNPATDWNFAQWTWYSKHPVWTIRFDTPAAQTGQATLTLGIACANPVKGNHTNLEIKVNGTPVSVLHLPKSGMAAYRSGSQDGAYRVEYIQFDARLLHAGTNEITLGHQEATPFPPVAEQMRGAVGAVMYDALRLEVKP